MKRPQIPEHSCVAYLKDKCKQMNDENAEYILLLNDKIEIDEKLVNENVDMQG